MSIAIGTPFYQSTCSSSHLVSLLGATKRLSSLGIDWGHLSVRGDPFIDRSRNSVMKLFLESGFNYLMMIDNDISFPADAILQLYRQREDVIAGVCPIREGKNSFRVDFVLDGDKNPVKSATGMIRCIKIGTAFMMVSRKVVQTLWDLLEKEKYFCDGMEFRPMFRTVVNNQAYCGEDYYFCSLLHKISFPIWIYPHITFGHEGNFMWEGNFADHLKEFPTGREAPAMLKRIGDPPVEGVDPSLVRRLDNLIKNLKSEEKIDG